MTFRIRLIGLFYLIPIWSFAQLLYSNSEASFQVSQQAGQYRVKCSLKRDVAGSRYLKRAQNRLRFRAVDLVGNYIIFSNLDVDLTDKNRLFGAFVDYNNLTFRAHVENFSAGQWEFSDGMRCITFTCSESDFIIGEKYNTGQFDFSAIMMLDFRRNKSIGSACRIVSAGLSGPFEILGMEMLFLSGNAPFDQSTAELQKLNPGGPLESSLFGTDSLMHSLIISDTGRFTGGCPFGEMVKSKIQFTGAGISLKDSIYQIYLENLAACDDLWYRVQLFSAEHRDLNGFYGLEQATVFDVIGTYPLALDVFGLRVGYQGKYFNRALDAFADNDMESALEFLRDEINYSGITPEALNLTGACYRILERPAKALPYLLLAFYIDRETTYLTGNTCLCLDAMHFNENRDLAEYFLNDPKTDNWSKNQILNFLNQ